MKHLKLEMICCFLASSHATHHVTINGKTVHTSHAHATAHAAAGGNYAHAHAHAFAIVNGMFKINGISKYIAVFSSRFKFCYLNK